MAGGIGFNGPINQFMDVYGQMLLHHVNYTKEEGDDSEFIYELNVGGRVWLTNQLLKFTLRLVVQMKAVCLLVVSVSFNRPIISEC